MKLAGTRPLTGAAAIDAVGDPYPQMRLMLFVLHLMLYYLGLLGIQDLIMIPQPK